MKSLVKHQRALFMLVSFLLATAAFNNKANAQCTSTSQDGSQTSKNTGADLSWTMTAGDYEKISSVSNGATYTVSSSISSDYITIRTGSANGGTVITSGTTPETFTATSTTIYVLVNRNSSCGTNNTNRTLTWNVAPYISSAPTSGCIGSSVDLVGTGFTGATQVTFHGVDALYTVNSSTSITATVPVGATTGLITVYGPGGSDVTTTFTVNASPSDNSGGNQSSCGGVVTLGASSTWGHTYSWTPSAGLSSATAANPTVTPASTTTFTLTERITSTGCTATNTTVVTVGAGPGNNTGGSKSVCNGSSVALGGSSVLGHTYSWSPTTGLSNAAVANPTATPSSTTTYTLTETVTATGCVSTNTAVVTVNPLPGDNSGSDKSTCSGVGVTLGASSTSGHSYRWSPTTGLSGSTLANPTATITTANTYTLTETITSTGCSVANSVAVSINTTPATPGAISGNATACQNSSGNTYSVAAVAGATSYTWTVPSGWNISSGGTTNSMTVTAGSSGGTITVKANNTCGSSSTASLSVSISSTSVTTPTVSGASPVCAGSTQVYTATSANSSTFTWTIPGGLTLVSGQGTNTLTVTAVSGNGLNLTVVGTNTCGNNSSNGVKVITVNAAPSATAGAAPSVCAGSSASLGTTTISGHTYSWSPSTGLSNAAVSNPTATPSSTTTYTLTETITSGGCTAANAVTVTVNPLPGDNSGSNKATCSGTGVALGASSVSGHTYRWSPATGLSSSTVANPTATISATATYTLTETITATGCSASNTSIVTVSKKSTAPTSATASVTNFCSGNGSSTILTLNGGGGGDNETIAWYSGSCGGTPVGTGNNLSVSPTSTTTYYGRYEDASPCSYNTACASVTITVNPAPADNSGSDKSICAGNSITLGAAAVTGHTYNWSPATGLSSSVAANPTATPAATTTYNLTETITATGCTAANPAVVTVNPIPTATIVPSYCNGGGNVLLTVSLNTAYKWSNGGTDQSITVDRAGTFYVTVTSSAGCTATTNNTVAIELVANGDFEAGNMGFTTTYSYQSAAGSLYPEGDYAVGTDANYYHNNFYGKDHTGGGKFMIVNGATSATPVVVWQESVTLVPNTNYYFSAYSTSMNQVSPYAQLKFAVNGVQVGTTAMLPQGAASTAGPFVWTRFYATWNSGSNTNVTLSIVDLQTAAGGNDFGLDDISCSTLSTVPLSINPATNTPCLGGTLNMTSNILGGMSPMTYVWSGPNNFNSTKVNDSIINVTALAAGVYNLTVTDAHGCVVSGSSDAAVINAPPADNAGVDMAMCTGTGITIGAASVTGHTYKWSPATGLSSSTAANPTATPASTTTYTLTETITASGCSATNNAVVTVSPLLGNNAGTNKTICNNGSIAIGAAATTGHTYSWSPVAGLSSATAANPTAAPTVTTTYTLTETITATGCSASNAVTVTVNPSPANNAGTNQAVCAGTGIAIGAASVAGHTYSWSPATGLSSSVVANPTATPASTTTYNLTETITASGCAATNSVVVTVNATLPNNAGANQSVCGGAGVAIGAAAVTGHTYRWTPATGISSSTSANPTATPTVTTTYTLAETLTATGCSATNTVVVTLNAAVGNNAGSAKTICNGASTTLGAASVTGHTYAWSPATGLSNAAIANPTANPTTTITYTLTEAITATGCTASNTAVVTVNPAPADNAGADQTICGGSGIAIGATAVAGHTYSWSPTTRLTSGVAANPTATPTVTTTYTLTETITATTCAATNSVVVTVGASLANNTGSAQSTCRGTSVTLGAATTSGHTYTWSPSATLSSATVSNPTATPTVTTTYTLAEAITASGCSVSNTVVVTVNAAPTISSQPSNQTTCGSTTTFSLTASGASSYQWYENRATGIFSAVSNGNNSFGQYKNATSNTLEIDKPTTAMNGWSYYCVVTGSSCGTTSSTATLTATNAGMWNGSSSINWDDAANWCGGVPDKNTDVTIPSGVPHQPTINANDAECHNLTINSGATVTVTSAGELSLYGDLVVNGTYTQTGGTFAIEGNSTQNIAGITAYNVIVDNNKDGATLTGNMKITNNLTFNNGILNTGSYEVNVTNTSTSAVANFDKSKYINGYLRRSVGITGTYNFPVGSADNCELAVLNLTALIGVSNIVANFNVASMGTPPASLSNGGKKVNKFLNYGYWTITPNQQPTLGVYSIVLNPTGHSNGGSADDYVVVKRPHGSGGTSWSMPGTNLLNIVPTILGAVGASMSGLTSFSDFGAGADGGTVLPIKLISFTGEKADNDVNALLKWSTATEENNDHFDIEVASSTDQNNGELSFRKIGEVKGAGNSVNELDYTFTDDEANKSGTRYYRLKQVDFDGNSTYSNIISLDFNLVKVELSTLFPNPVTDILHFNLTSQDKRTVTVSVNNLVGQEIFREVETLTDGINAMTLDVTQLHKGIFLLSVTDGTAKYQPQKFEKL